MRVDRRRLPGNQLTDRRVQGDVESARVERAVGTERARQATRAKSHVDVLDTLSLIGRRIDQRAIDDLHIVEAHRRRSGTAAIRIAGRGGRSSRGGAVVRLRREGPVVGAVGILLQQDDGLAQDHPGHLHVTGDQRQQRDLDGGALKADHLRPGALTGIGQFHARG